MIKDMKLAFKMFKYGIQGKSLGLLFLIFMGLGIFMEIFATSAMDNMGGIYMVLCPTYVAQLVITSTVSLYVSSSPYKLKLQTTIPVTLNFILMVITFGFFITLRLLRLFVFTSPDPELIKDHLCGIIFVAFLVLVLQIYSVITYRSFILSICFFLPMFMVAFMGHRFFFGRISRIGFLRPIYEADALTIVLISAALTVLGYVIAMILAKALYKMELDPRTYKNALARVGR